MTIHIYYFNYYVFFFKKYFILFYIYKDCQYFLKLLQIIVKLNPDKKIIMILSPNSDSIEIRIFKSSKSL